MSAIQGLFSDAVVAVESRDALDASLLWPEEDAALGQVSAGRRWDWVMGRRCARLAIEALGLASAPVLSGSGREPLWPGGVVGAITHTSGYAAAAVAHADSVRAVGIDAEPDEPLPSGVIRRVAFDDEHRWLDGDVGGGVANPDRLLFTVKEAVYKAWFPLAQQWLGFEDARVSLDVATQRFEARILVEGPLRTVEGRYGSAAGIVIATIEHT